MSLQDLVFFACVVIGTVLAHRNHRYQEWLEAEDM